MSVVEAGFILNKDEIVKITHGQILGLINYVYDRSQDRYEKLSKKARKVICELHGGDYDVNTDSSDYYRVECKEDYKIEPFNILLDELKEKDLKYILGKAEIIHSTLKMLDVEINTRLYNLLRHLMLNKS